MADVKCVSGETGPQVAVREEDEEGEAGGTEKEGAGVAAMQAATATETGEEGVQDMGGWVETAILVLAAEERAGLQEGAAVATQVVTGRKGVRW